MTIYKQKGLSKRCRREVQLRIRICYEFNDNTLFYLPPPGTPLDVLLRLLPTPLEFLFDSRIVDALRVNPLAFISCNISERGTVPAKYGFSLDTPVVPVLVDPVFGEDECSIITRLLLLDIVGEKNDDDDDAITGED